MPKRMTVSCLALLLSFGLMSAASVRTARGLSPSATPGPAIAEPRSQTADCSDGKKVAKAIYAFLRKKGFTKQQLDRINVFFNPANKVLTLQGIVLPPSTKPSKEMVGVNKAGKLAAQATTCPSSVDNQLTPFAGGNCTPPRLPCGQTGVCLPPDECNVKKAP